LGGRLVGAKAAIFFFKPVFKKYVRLVVWCLPPSGHGKRLWQDFGGFFHQIKEHQQIGKEDFTQAVCRRMRKFEGFKRSKDFKTELI
jgi:hypothetical protein